jgi:hypothetical protein
MALPGFAHELVAFAAAAVAFAALLVALARGSGRWAALELAPWAAFLLILYQSGFLRQDAHELTSASALLGLALLAAPRARSGPRGVLLLGAATLALGAVDLELGLLHYQRRGLALAALQAGPRSAIAALARVATPDSARDDLARRLEWLRRRRPLPAIEGGVDIYPSDQVTLLAHGLDYRPRPIFQSYVVYTPELARRNADALARETAAPTVLLEVAPIDQRWPSLEDGPSWPELLARYDPTELASGFLVLRRARAPRPVSFARLLETRARTGERVELTAGGDELVWATIDVRPSIAGRLRALALRPAPVWLTATTRAGDAVRARLVPGMARAGFLLSPLVRDARDFGALGDRAARRERLGERAIVSFAVDGAGLEPEVAIKLDRLDVTSPALSAPDARPR